MRRAILLVMFSLCACGEDQTPLSHAIAALRARDSAGMTAAKSEADAAVQTAVQPADMCKITMEDVRKYSEVGRIAKLADPDLMRLPEEDRLIYALKIAGEEPKIVDEPRLAQSPLYKAAIDHDESALKACNINPLQMMAGADDAGEEARAAALKDWMQDVRTRLGAGYDARMADAASHLSNLGYSASWPAQTSFIGDPPQTFADVQRKLK